jgi:predicted nucleic acid-binding protein
MSASHRITLDTNILIYAVDLDAGQKNDMAREWLGAVARHDGILTVQALGEFYHATTRKALLSQTEAESYIDNWRAVFTVVAANEVTLENAIAATRSHGFSFWDAMICVTADQAGCATVLSEDMQHGRKLGGMEILNPFREDAAALIDRLLR